MAMLDGLIQIAGIIDLAEAEMIASAGVHQIGFPLRLAVHEEDLSEQQAAAVIAHLPAAVTAVLITYLQDAGEIAGLCARLGVRTVQLHSDISAGEIVRLKTIAPRLFVIKSLIVQEDNLAELLSGVQAYSACVDAFITDTYDPSSGACGATGKTHDWSVSRRLVDASERPVILAGGLNPHNVRDAIAQVRPAGVDVHTGVEGADGRKDEALVEAFVAEAKAAFARCRRKRR